MDASFVTGNIVSSHPHMTAHHKTGGRAQLRKKNLTFFLAITQTKWLINRVMDGSHLWLIKEAATLDYELYSLKFLGGIFDDQACRELVNCRG